ncbi:hypothetical protein [Thioalkalivibrio sp.]|uniref:hypothetical protein n=1 Tax=Thioalkalivibrio sp. TaxID=2093813 RepID=UPI0025DB6E81|nr:hypothetical protein [Thioalkalivibrio sp.]
MSSVLVNPMAPALVPGFLALGILTLTGACPLRRGLALAWRLKWFFLSLLFFFGWWYPGAGPWGWERLLPSPEGLSEAAMRIAALVLIVCWVAWLTGVFDRNAQIQGLARWLSLLRPLGLRGEVFANRLFLALDYFEAQRADYLEFRERIRGSRRGRLKAGREFLISGLEGALAGAAPAGRQAMPGETGTGKSQDAAGELSWQVALLWIAVLVALAIRVAG